MMQILLLWTTRRALLLIPMICHSSARAWFIADRYMGPI